MKTFNSFRTLLLLSAGLSLLTSLTARADTEVNQNPLTIVESHFSQSQVSAGATAELVFKLQLDKHFHAYADRFKVKIENPDEIKIDKLKISPLVQFKDAVSGKMKEGMEGSATASALSEFPIGMKPGKYNVDVAFQYQACSKDTCLFPITLHVKVPFELLAGAKGAEVNLAAASVGPKSGESAKKTDLENALSKGFLSAILFVFAVGFLTSLTPCIYPMIPITLAVLGAKSKNQTRARSFFLSITYVLGIGLTYSILGVIAASTGSLFGSALSNIYVVTAIALVFVIMGLSMYGLFEIQAPAFIRNRLGSGQSQAGYGGAFATGLVAGIVASPCIGPVLVTILAYIAQTQNLLLGFILLFTFAMGMGVLFVVLGTFSQLFNKVPKAGAWMETVKFIFGTTMVGMGLYYVAPIYPNWLFQALLALALILIASNFGAFDANQGLSPLGRMRKGFMLSVFVIGTLFAVLGALNKMNIQLSGMGSQEYAANQKNPSGPKMNWQSYSSDLLTKATQNHQAVIVDFSADWCGACKELEKYTFTDKDIITESQRFVLLRVDATEESESLTKLKNQYKVVGLPTMIFIDSKGQTQDSLTLTGFEEAPGFLKRMKTVQLEQPQIQRQISSEK